MATRTDPYNFRVRTITKSGLRILIRPIRSNDELRVEALFKILSPESLYFRFFMRIKTPSKEMLAKLLDVDHDRDVVLVAIEKRRKRENILGIFRLVCCREGRESEFSLLVGDPWQGQGVGARLFQYGLFWQKPGGLNPYGDLLCQKTKLCSILPERWGLDAIGIPT